MLMTASASVQKSEREQLEVVEVDVHAERVKLEVGNVLVDIAVLHLEFREPLLGAFVFHRIDEGLLFQSLQDVRVMGEDAGCSRLLRATRAYAWSSL
jgi:hypothetical protein